MQTKTSAILEQGRAKPDASPDYIQRDDESRKAGPFEWWYRLTAPPPVPSSGSLEQREVARRGRVTSTLALLEAIVILVLAMPSALATHHLLVLILLLLLGIMGVALIFNRKGKLFIAGLLLVLSVSVSMPMSVLTTPGGLQPKTILLYDLMIQTDLLAVSVLPAGSVFLTAIFNCAFILGDIAWQPHSHNFDVLLAQAGGEVIGPPVVLHLLVAIVTYIWVRSATQAINRADRAEVIARLEHDLAERDRDIASQKQLLDADILQIETTHQQIANGNLAARVPIERITVLWGVAGKLNNLLTRFQRLQHVENEMYRMQYRLQYSSQMEAEIVRIRSEAQRQAEAIRAARSSRRPFLPTPTSTVLDPMLAELHASYITPTDEVELYNRMGVDQ